MLFAVDDVVWQALIGAAVTVILAVLQVWAKLAADKAARKAEWAAREAATNATAAKTQARVTAAQVENVAESLSEHRQASAEKLDSLNAAVAEIGKKVDGQ